MHIGSRRRRSVAICVPHIQNLSGGHLVIFVFGVGLVFFTAYNLLDDFIGVKFGKMVVVPGRDGCICFITMDSIDVGWFVKQDESIAGVSI
jgi:hypothetical protein